MLFDPTPPGLPVVMYHSIGRRDPGWAWRSLTCSAPLFAAQIELLKAEGWRAATLDDLRDFQEGGGRPDRRVVFTFDDGFLDNWVRAYPLLKRHGWRGIVYVNPDFVDPGEEPRPNLEDVWSGRCAESDLPGPGYMNLGELRRLADEGVLEIGCHSRSHTWYPTGPEIVDFHRPGVHRPWLNWNARPDRKPFTFVDAPDAHAPWGTPVHVHGRSLGVRRHFPDDAPAEACVAHVAAAGGAAFFDGPDWRERLLALCADAGPGRAESDDEMRARYRDEIVGGRAELERMIGRPTPHFCWPGGAYNDEAWAVADEAGFATLTVTRSDRTRWLSSDPRLVRRISCNDSFTLAGRRYATANPRFLGLACEGVRGTRGAMTRLRLMKVLSALSRGGRGR